MVEFSGLSRRDSGARASTLDLQGGTAYLNFKGDKQEEFSLAFGRQRLVLTKPSHLRVELRDSSATVAVFQGDVEVEGSPEKVEVEKKHSATFDLTGTTPYTLANNLEPDPYDDWDKEQEKYHQQYSASNSYSPYAYGASDLNYYGSFYNIPGYGMMWQPYLIGAGWDPFMNGAWTWYPGAGYTWVSAYPWGWTPYRYGSWTYLPASGWFWQPGSTWAGWNTVPRIVNAPQRFNMPRPPVSPGQTLLVNRSSHGRGWHNSGSIGNTRRFRGSRRGPRHRAQSGQALATGRGQAARVGKFSSAVARCKPAGRYAPRHPCGAQHPSCDGGPADKRWIGVLRSAR